MARRGSKATLDAREEAYVRSLSESGDIVCVPWTGVDAAGVYVCPGFEFKPDRGLMAYVVPLEVVRYAGLIPGFNGTPVGTTQRRDPKTNPNLDGITTGPQTMEPAPIAGGRLSKEAIESEYFRLLRLYLRLVKIVGPETENKFLPYVDDYYVVVSGPYQKARIGHLYAKPDGTGARFAVADGVPFSSSQTQLEASRLKTPLAAPPRNEVGTLPGGGGTPSIPTGDVARPAAARVSLGIAAIRDSGSFSVMTPGTPKPGKAHSKEAICDT